jgi:hypothetical protein
MASAIWPPPMNVILLVIVGLGTSGSKKSRADPHHHGLPFDSDVIIVRHTHRESFKETVPIDWPKRRSVNSRRRQK